MTYNDKLQLKAIQTLIFGVFAYGLRFLTIFYMESFSLSGVVFTSIGSFINLFAIIIAIIGAVYFIRGINEKFTLGKIFSSIVVFGYLTLVLISLVQFLSENKIMWSEWFLPIQFRLKWRNLNCYIP